MKETLYRIFNVVNSKSYIGKTYRDPYNRLAEHCRDYTKYKTRPLYAAFHKYGLDSFSFEILGEYDNPEIAECELIQKYNSYGSTGYNATLGGDGTSYIDSTLVLEKYKSNPCVERLSRQLNVDAGTIRSILKANNINPLSTVKMSELLSNSILLLETGEVYTSTKECAQALIDADISEVSNYQTQQGIRRVCHGLRKSYLGLKFKYAG